jgi:hypothetical protein
MLDEPTFLSLLVADLPLYFLQDDIQSAFEEFD